jgi:monomeric isocitrate dehydrogenase
MTRAVLSRITVAERITVALIPEAGAELEHLQDKTGLSKTDIVNRAVMLYEFLDAWTVEHAADSCSAGHVFRAHTSARRG